MAWLGAKLSDRCSLWNNSTACGLGGMDIGKTIPLNVLFANVEICNFKIVLCNISKALKYRISPANIIIYCEYKSI